MAKKKKSTARKVKKEFLNLHVWKNRVSGKHMILMNIPGINDMGSYLDSSSYHYIGEYELDVTEPK